MRWPRNVIAPAVQTGAGRGDEWGDQNQIGHVGKF